MVRLALLMVALLVLAFALLLSPAFTWLERAWGTGPAAGMVFAPAVGALLVATVLERIKRENDLVTYREILAPAQLDYMMEWMYSEESLQGQFRAGHVWFIASSDGEPCGYVSVERQGGDLFHLQKIYVLPRFQGLGAGEFLFRRAVEYIRSVHPGPCMMELNVNRRNRALHFYERMGMRRLREGDFPIGDGYYMNDYIMGLEIV